MTAAADETDLPLETPVVIFAFNRPDITRRTMDAVRAARPGRVLLIADGPRDDRPDDRALTSATRDVLDGIDWPCDVSRRYLAANHGVEASVETGLDWVFSQVTSAIVFEDDCIADPSFFTFADQLLSRYRDDRRVWQISGNNFGIPEKLFADSYAFSAWGSVWGWATWADRWHAHRTVFPRDYRPHDGALGTAPVRTRPARPESATLVTPSGRHHFDDAATSQDIISHGWDKHWWLTMMTEGGLAITPSRNLVENVGWGADATHGVTTERQDHPAQRIDFPLRHPAEVVVDVEVERDLELVLSRVGGRTARAARRLIRSPRARRVARSIAYSRPVVRVSRSWSRLTSRTRA
jgi:hypothetical protein